ISRGSCMVSRLVRGAQAALALGMALGLLLPAGAQAIDLTAGKIAKSKNKPGEFSDKGLIKIVKDPGIAEPLPSPLCPAASTIRLTTDLGDALGTFDCNAWSAKGKGFGYADPFGQALGAQKVLFKPGGKGGKLVIKL